MVPYVVGTINILTKGGNTMKQILIAVLVAVAAAFATPVHAADVGLSIFATPARAADVGVSISIGQPGFYGHLDIGDFPAPQVFEPQPVIIEHGVPMDRPPIYLRVPAKHRKHWRKYCHEYNACGERVLFVQDGWYNKVYAPRYRELERERHHERRVEERHEDRGRRMGGDHDRGRDRDRDRGRDHDRDRGR
jgi:hypothetical protein